MATVTVVAAATALGMSIRSASNLILAIPERVRTANRHSSEPVLPQFDMQSIELRNRNGRRQSSSDATDNGGGSVATTGSLTPNTDQESLQTEGKPV
jgi:hypothetical protein